MASGIGHPDREVLMGPSFLCTCCVPGSGLNTAHRRPHAILTYYGNFKLKRGEHRPRDTRCPQPSTCTGKWLQCWPSSRTPAAWQYGALLSDSRGQSLVTPRMGQRTLETCLASLHLPTGGAHPRPLGGAARTTDSVSVWTLRVLFLPCGIFFLGLLVPSGDQEEKESLCHGIWWLKRAGFRGSGRV